MGKVIVGLMLLTSFAFAQKAFVCEAISGQGVVFEGQPKRNLRNAKNSALNVCHRQAVFCTITSCSQLNVLEDEDIDSTVTAIEEDGK